MKTNRRPVSEWINDKLREPDGETFKAGKWRFWFPLVMGLTALSSAMTVAIFGFGNVSALIGAVVGLVGALLCWLNVGNLHYSDSGDEKLAKNVSLLDSITLGFVILHFCGLLYILGHLIMLRGAESKYEAQAQAYNEKAKDVSGDNVKIAEAARQIASETTKAERLRNDTAYQQRKAAEAGFRAARSSAKAEIVPASLSTAQIELEKPKPPEESSTAFLASWDVWIRVANFGELILAAITLIYIRNRSARHNAPYSSGNGPRNDFQGSAGVRVPFATVAALRQDFRTNATPVATVAEGQDSLKILREHLRVIAFGLPGRWFKADLIAGGVAIRLCERCEGREVTIRSTRQSAKLLAAVNKPDFRERLINELKRQDFPIGGGE